MKMPLHKTHGHRLKLTRLIFVRLCGELPVRKLLVINSRHQHFDHIGAIDSVPLSAVNRQTNAIHWKRQIPPKTFKLKSVFFSSRNFRLSQVSHSFRFGYYHLSSVRSSSNLLSFIEMQQINRLTKKSKMAKLVVLIGPVNASHHLNLVEY